MVLQRTLVGAVLGFAVLAACGAGLYPASDVTSSVKVSVADPTDVGPPPSDHGLAADLVERLLASTVHVRGLDCRTAQEGSGFVVEGGLVATGAHVVSGIRLPTIVLGSSPDDRAEVASRVVAFDQVADLALLKPVDGDTLPPPLDFGQPVDGTVGALLVHDGETARAIPVGIERRIRATGRDIYGEPAGGRDALVLAASVDVGYSGGAVVDVQGLAVGVAFSRSRGGRPVAYAVQTGELAALLGRVGIVAEGSGPCRDG